MLFSASALIVFKRSLSGWSVESPFDSVSPATCCAFFQSASQATSASACESRCQVHLPVGFGVIDGLLTTSAKVLLKPHCEHAALVELSLLHTHGSRDDEVYP